MRRVALALACTACGPSAYVCTEPSQCMDAGAIGVCQPDGFCSFPDEACPSGQRYGEHGGSMSGQCVAETDDTGTDGSTTSTTASTTTSIDTTIDPVSSSTTPVTVSSSSTDPDPTTSTSIDPSTSDATTEGPIATEPLLWFSFDAVGVDGIANEGSLGGTAACGDLTCPAVVEGAVGTAARFDGVDDCAIFPHARALGPLDALSISAWLLRDAIDPDYDCILCKPVGVDPWNTWRLATYDDPKTGGLLDFRVGTANNSGTSIAGGISTGTWVHAVGVWNGQDMVLWLDGEIALEYANDLYEVDEQSVFLGCDDDHGVIGPTNFLTGAIDEVRFWDRAISEDEIAALFAERM